jgi:hypothetical protein
VVERHVAVACSSGGVDICSATHKRAPTCRPSCFFDRPDVEEPRQGGHRQRTRLRRSWWPCLRPRQNRRGNGGSDREGHDNDGSSLEDDDPTKGTIDLAGMAATTVNPVGKAMAATDPTKAMKEWAMGRV